VWEEDGWPGVWAEAQDETQASGAACLSLECAGHSVSSSGLGQGWFVRQLRWRPLICKGLVQDLALKGLPLSEALADRTETFLNT